jgi:hypothetical protein
MKHIIQGQLKDYHIYYEKQIDTSIVNPNKTSQIVSHFTNNNDPTAQYIKSCEK